MNIESVVRRFVKTGLGVRRDVRMTALESVAVAQTEPARYEASRAGRRFMGGNQIIANGIAPVTAIPTTTATLALYNGEQAGGKCYVLERLGFWLGSGTPAAGATLLATVSTQPIVTAVTANATGYGSQSASGSSSGTKAMWGTAVTLPNSPVVAWMQICSTFQLAAANVGQGDMVQDLEGMLVVPPRCALGLAILSGAGTTPLYGISATWVEIDTDLE
jgi:hypothetical protein